MPRAQRCSPTATRAPVRSPAEVVRGRARCPALAAPASRGARAGTAGVRGARHRRADADAVGEEPRPPALPDNGAAAPSARKTVAHETAAAAGVAREAAAEPEAATMIAAAPAALAEGAHGGAGGGAAALAVGVPAAAANGAAVLTAAPAAGGALTQQPNGGADAPGAREPAALGTPAGAAGALAAASAREAALAGGDDARATVVPALRVAAGALDVGRQAAYAALPDAGSLPAFQLLTFFAIRRVETTEHLRLLPHMGPAEVRAWFDTERLQCALEVRAGEELVWPVRLPSRTARRRDGTCHLRRAAQQVWVACLGEDSDCLAWEGVDGRAAPSYWGGGARHYVC